MFEGGRLRVLFVFLGALLFGDAAALGQPAEEQDDRAFCRRLEFVGTAQDVPRLEELLADPACADAARRALECIPGEESLAALRRALSLTDRALLVGVVNSLGARRDAASLTAIAAQATAEDPELRAAAISAIGRIGGTGTGRLLLVLESALPEAESTRAAFGHAMLECAAGLREANEHDEAQALYGLLHARRFPRAVRIGAFLGHLAYGGQEATKQLGRVLRGQDPVLVDAALRHLASPAGHARLGELVELLPECSETTQRRLVALAISSDETDAARLRRIAELTTSRAARRQAVAACLTRASASLENLALGAAATSPDDIEPDHAGQEAPAAIDGNEATYWDEVDHRQLYRFELSLPEPRAVSALCVQGYAHHDFAPRDFEVKLDGETVARVRGAQYVQNRLWVLVPRTVCRTVELSITGHYGRSPAIRELGVYDVGEELATLAEALAGDDDLARGFIPDEEEFELEWKRTDHDIALMNRGTVVWQLNRDWKLGKAYFHPVALLDGTPLTWLSPPDHVWHRALWFEWKFINGVNYWEDVAEKGLTEIVEMDAKLEADFSAKLRFTIDYHPPGGAPVMREVRRVAVSAPDADGSYLIDWTGIFTSLAGEVLLDRTPPADEPDGKSWGGYSGMSVRLAKETSDWRLTDSEGRTGMECHRQPARWVHADFRHRVTGREAGIAILDAPENPRHPTPSFVVLTEAQPFVYYSPSVLFNEPYTLRELEPLTLRYRILIHPGRAEHQRIDEEWQSFAKSTATSAGK